MNSFSLKEKYAKAEATLRGGGGSGEVTALIHRTPWLRILLVNNQEDEHSLSIEVEISIPDSDGKGELKSSELIDTLSKHLLYLQQLRNSGFELSVIGTGCIYCASLDLDESPKDNLFRALIPPQPDQNQSGWKLWTLLTSEFFLHLMRIADYLTRL